MSAALAFLSLLQGSPGSWADTEVGSITVTNSNVMVANPVTDRVYIARASVIDVVYRLDGGIGALGASIPVGAAALAVDPAANRLYASVPQAARVAIIDGESHAVSYVENLAAFPGALAINPVTGRLYVTLAGTNKVAVVDVATRAVLAEVAAVSSNVVAVDPVSNRVFVGSTTNNGIVAIDGATHAVSFVATTHPVADMAVDSGRGKVYAVGMSDGLFDSKLTVLDEATGNTTSVAISDYPRTVAVDAAANKVIVGTGGIGNVVGHVSIVDGDTLLVTTVVNRNGDCCRVAVNPTSGKAYAGAQIACSNCSQKPLTIIDGATVTDLYALATSLAVNPVTNRIHALGGAQGPMGMQLHTLRVIDGAPITPKSNGLLVSIGALPGDAVGSSVPRFTFTASTTSSLPVQRVYYRVGGIAGQWLAATGSGSNWSGRLQGLAPGMHTIHAFAVDARAAIPRAPLVGEIASYTFTVTSQCQAGSGCADLSVSQAAMPPQPSTGRDLVVTLSASNAGLAPATNVVVTNTLPSGIQFIWASPGCTLDVGVVTCAVGAMQPGANAVRHVVVRPGLPGVLTNSAGITSSNLDPQMDDNQSSAQITVTASPVASLVQRYRLYSDVTKEHHFTTDLNEYTVLGGNGNWVQEGTVGRVLDNPGSFGGVQAVPYYRLYDTATQWHHWTTDANEYYTLIQFGNWNAEGVDGYILPTNTAGATELYRLNYPFLPGLHHWTIDPAEYAALIAQFGWIGEPGAGFVVQ